MIEIFYIATICALVLILIFVISILFPSTNLWPPKQETSEQKFTWHFAIIWIPATIGYISIFIIGILDWNSLAWPLWFRYGVGLTLFLLGSIFLFLGIFQLGIAKTGGMKGELIVDGLFRYSRNPQYVAEIILLAGWGIFSASTYANILVILAIINFVLMPFAEEPWLSKTYGKNYDDYKKRTPRFLFF